VARDVSTLNIEVTAEDKASGVITRLAGVLKDRLVVTIGEVVEGLRRMTEAFAEPIDLASKQEDAIKRLSNALSDQGASAARHLTEALVEQAEALQNTTRFSNDAIEAGQAFAAAFIKNENALKGVTQSAVDLASGLGIDLQTAFELLTRAAQGQTQTLARYGLILDENIPKGEKLAALQGVIAERFGGRAQADVKTYGGALAQLGNAWEDLLKAIGEAVVKNNAIVEGIRSLTGSVIAAIPKVAEFAKELVNIGVAAAPGALRGLEGLGAFLASFTLVLSLSAEAAIKTARGIIYLTQLLPGLGDAFSNAEQKLGDLDDALDPLQQSLAKAVAEMGRAALGMEDLGTKGAGAAKGVTDLGNAAAGAGPAFTTYGAAAESAAQATIATATASAKASDSLEGLSNTLLLTGDGFANYLVKLNAVKAAYAALADTVQTAAQRITGANDSMLGPLDQPGDPLPSNLGRSRGGASAILTYGQAYSQQAGGLVRTTKIANTASGGNVARTYTVFGVLPDGKVFPLGQQVIGPDGTILSGQQFG